MIDLEDLYFDWLLTRIDERGVTEGVAHLCYLLHNCDFMRRVGNDVNRAIDGENLRNEFLTLYSDANFDPHVTNHLISHPCSWLEMLVTLARSLDYLYDGGVDGRMYELFTNMHIIHIAEHAVAGSTAVINFDQRVVNAVTAKIDTNKFGEDGRGGLFPLEKPDHPDQREVEIWDQQAAYFREKLEGVLWTSIN